MVKAPTTARGTRHRGAGRQSSGQEQCGRLFKTLKDKKAGLDEDIEEAGRRLKRIQEFLQ